MAREDLHFRLRIPEELKNQIEKAAAENHRSMTAEIVSRLQDSFVSLMERDEKMEFLENYVETLERERVSLFENTNNQERALQTLKDAQRTIAIMVKALGQAILDQGDRSDFVRLLAEGLADVEPDRSSDPSAPIPKASWED
ncbi:MAG: Arc family DNA-binding protein [Mesorhizobium sp.]